MAIPLKQSTASQEIILGPFLDEDDGKTAETGLSIGNTDIKLWKHGATSLANKNSGGATHISGGLYSAVLDATDTNTLGALVIHVHMAGALPVRVECVVLPANVYDSLIGGSDTLDVQVAGINAGAITAAAIATDAIDADALAADALAAIGNAVDIGFDEEDVANEVMGAAIEAGFSLRQSLRIMLSALAGKLSGATTNEITFRDVNDSKARITATINEDGDRVDVQLDPD